MLRARKVIYLVHKIKPRVMMDYRQKVLRPEAMCR